MSKTATEDYQTHIRGNNAAMHARIQELEAMYRGAKLSHEQDIVAHNDERDTLKTKLDEQARDTLVVLDERDELRKQNDVNVQYAKAKIEHIRAQLAEANERYHRLDDINIVLNIQLAEAKRLLDNATESEAKWMERALVAEQQLVEADKTIDLWKSRLADAKIQEKEHHLMLHELRVELDETERLRAECWEVKEDLRMELIEANERLEQAHESAPTINGNQHTPNSDFTADDLRAKVKELQAPTIMKQTFAPIYPYLIDSPLPPQPSRELALNWGPGDALGVLRFDHMSDGTVTETLEPTTGEK